MGATCGDFDAVGSAAAIVQHGRVGASTNATDVKAGISTEGFAGWGDDQLLTTNIGNPAQTGTTTISLNFMFDGGFGGFGAPISSTSASLGLEANGAIFSLYLLHTDHGDSCTSGSNNSFANRFLLALQWFSGTAGRADDIPYHRARGRAVLCGLPHRCDLCRCRPRCLDQWRLPAHLRIQHERACRC